MNTKKTWTQTVEDLGETFRKWGVTKWAIDPNPRTAREAERYSRWNGHPRAVMLRFTLRGAEVVLQMTKHERALDNLRTLYLSAERLRMLDAADLTEVVREMLRQLPAPGRAAPAPNPYQLLGLEPNASMDQIKAAYKAKARTFHPDAGGGTAEFQRLTEALDQIKRERGVQ